MDYQDSEGILDQTSCIKFMYKCGLCNNLTSNPPVKTSWNDAKEQFFSICDSCWTFTCGCGEESLKIRKMV